METSISDRANYTNACASAASCPEAFSRFRTNPDYMWVLDHVNREQGLEYLGRLREHGFSEQHIRLGALNDLVGGPATIDIGTDYQISPTTLRYLNVVLDLQQHFGDMTGFRVCEIGVGYGGQLRVLDHIHKFSLYTMVDLPPVLALAQRYLGHFSLRTSLACCTMEELNGHEHDYDLVISNYAFSELVRSVQEVYFEKLIAPARNGYMVYNHISPPEYNSMTAVELSRRKNGEILPEPIQTHPDNRIVIWKPPVAVQ